MYFERCLTSYNLFVCLLDLNSYISLYKHAVTDSIFVCVCVCVMAPVIMTWMINAYWA
jgi:hypothetical protein